VKALWILAILWTIPWKGVTLWKAARNYQEGWFVAVLILETSGFLEILYILFFQRGKHALRIVQEALKKANELREA
jgi:hypothetical protein